MLEHRVRRAAARPAPRAAAPAVGLGRLPPPRATAPSTQAPINSGIRSSRSECPVGAVSNTTRSKRPRVRDDQLRHPVEERDVGHAGHRRRQLDLPRGLLQHRRAEEARHPLLRLVQVAAGLGVGVESPSRTGPAALSRSAGAQRHLEDVGRRVRRVGGHEEHAPPERGSPPARAPPRTSSCPRRPCRRRTGCAARAGVARVSSRRTWRAASGRSPIRRCQRWNSSSRYGWRSTRYRAAGFGRPMRSMKHSEQEQVLQLDRLGAHLPLVAGERHARAGPPRRAAQQTATPGVPDRQPHSPCVTRLAVHDQARPEARVGPLDRRRSRPRSSTRGPRTRCRCRPSGVPTSMFSAKSAGMQRAVPLLGHQEVLHDEPAARVQRLRRLPEQQAVVVGRVAVNHRRHEHEVEPVAERRRRGSRRPPSSPRPTGLPARCTSASAGSTFGRSKTTAEMPAPGAGERHRVDARAAADVEHARHAVEIEQAHDLGRRLPAARVHRRDEGPQPVVAAIVDLGQRRPGVPSRTTSVSRLHVSHR